MIRLRTHFAGICLALAFALFLACLAFEDYFWWLGFPRAFAEAALIGGLADWFAVVALFRHPLGLKLPHTAIIPNNQEKIADSLAGFIKKNFLSDEVMAERLDEARLREYDLPGRAGRWLGEPENLSRVLDEVLFTVKEGVVFLNDEDLKRFFSENTSDVIRRYRMGPTFGKLLADAVETDRHMEFFDHGVEWFDRVLDKVSPRSSWWQVFDKLKLFTMKREISAMRGNPEHILRKIFDDRARAFAKDLQESAPYTVAFEREIKEEILAKPDVFEAIDKLWERLKTFVVEDIDSPDSRIRDKAGSLVRRITSDLLENPAVKERINVQIRRFLAHLAANYRDAIAGFISSQVRSWDAKRLTDELEEQVGHDLQYIRLNGTIIGGFIGLAIYTAVFFIKG